MAGILLCSSLIGNFIRPASADNSGWTLQVTGAVFNPLTLSLADLAAMPQTTVHADLICVGTLITSGNWGGVSLSYILQQAEVNEAVSVVFQAADGYSNAISIGTAFQPDVIIATQKDGQPLTEVLRLVLPGTNGNLWVALITQIVLSATPVEPQGMPLNKLLPSPSPSPTPKQMPTPPAPSPSASPTTQPKTSGNVSSPVVPPAAADSQAVNGASGSGSSWPVVYAYLIVAVAAATATAAVGYSFYKQRKSS